MSQVHSWKWEAPTLNLRPIDRLLIVRQGKELCFTGNFAFTRLLQCQDFCNDRKNWYTALRTRPLITVCDTFIQTVLSVIVSKLFHQLYFHFIINIYFGTIKYQYFHHKICIHIKLMFTRNSVKVEFNVNWICNSQQLVQGYYHENGMKLGKLPL